MGKRSLQRDGDQQQIGGRASGEAAGGADVIADGVPVVVAPLVRDAEPVGGVGVVEHGGHRGQASGTGGGLHPRPGRHRRSAPHAGRLGHQLIEHASNLKAATDEKAPLETRLWMNHQLCTTPPRNPKCQGCMVFGRARLGASPDGRDRFDDGVRSVKRHERPRPRHLDHRRAGEQVREPATEGRGEAAVGHAPHDGHGLGEAR